MKRGGTLTRTPIARGASTLKRSGIRRGMKPMAQFNPVRIAKKRKVYTTYLRSAEWLQLRYERFLLDQGMCRCEWCEAARLERKVSGMVPCDLPEGVYAGEAFLPIPVHFTASGTAPWRRIRGFSTHHVRYDLTNPKLSDLRTMLPHHHAATEAKYSTRRRYLRSPHV